MSYQIKYKIWIEADQQTFLGSGRIKLLKAVEELGSLNKAAKKLNISYKKAWDLIQSVNETAQKPMITTTTGGSGGGGMTLTDYGKTMIARYEHLSLSTAAFMHRQKFEQ
jgi:molybdate transport system regulatory protein